VSSTSVLAVAAGHQVNIQGGTLLGLGTIMGNLTNSGTVHPGDGPGLLSLSGNYTQTSAGILDIQLGGPAPGTGYSVLSAGGTATLDGILDISLINGFIPINGEVFTILTAGSVNGVFSTVNGLHQGSVNFIVVYEPNAVILEVESPEPASLLLFGCGLACLGAYSASRPRRAA
jgi:hypothetical protein